MAANSAIEWTEATWNPALVVQKSAVAAKTAMPKE
jgi:protein gp37